MKRTVMFALLAAASVAMFAPQASAQAYPVTKGSSAASAEVQRGSSGDDIQATHHARLAWYGPVALTVPSASPQPITLSSAVLATYGVTTSYNGPVFVQAWPKDATFCFSGSTITPTVLGRPTASGSYLDSGALKVGNRVWFQGLTGPAEVRYSVGVLE